MSLSVKEYSVLFDGNGSIADILLLGPLAVADNHPLASVNPLANADYRGAPAHTFMIPVSWWIGHLVASKLPCLHTVDWEFVDKVTCGQVRRVLFDCLILRDNPALLMIADGSGTLSYGCPDLLSFCLQIASQFDLGTPVRIPASLPYTHANTFSSALIFERFFQIPTPPIPPYRQRWLIQNQNGALPVIPRPNP